VYRFADYKANGVLQAQERLVAYSMFGATGPDRSIESLDAFMNTLVCRPFMRFHVELRTLVAVCCFHD
jgi:hypothetical protein